jgi:beta-fructofuranosidase
LPRQLTLADDGTLRQQPIPATAKLLGEEAGEEAFTLPMAARRLPNVKGNTSCILLKFDPTKPKGAIGLNVRCSADGKRKVRIAYDNGALNVAGTKYALGLEGDEQSIILVVFVDESVLEVYAQNGRVCITKVLKNQNPADTDAEVFSDKGEVEIEKLKSWPMKSTYEK